MDKNEIIALNVAKQLVLRDTNMPHRQELINIVNSAVIVKWISKLQVKYLSWEWHDVLKLLKSVNKRALTYKRPYICVAVWEKRGKDAKLVIEKIDQQIIKDS